MLWYRFFHSTSRPKVGWHQVDRQRFSCFISSFMVLRIHIPPGCEDGQVIKVRLADDVVIPGAQYDQNQYIYLYISVKPSNQFTRDGWNVHSKTDATISQLLLGGTTSIKGLHEKTLELKIPPLQDLSSSICLSNQGIRRNDINQAGNHYVKMGLFHRVHGQSTCLMSIQLQVLRCPRA